MHGVATHTVSVQPEELHPTKPESSCVLEVIRHSRSIWLKSRPRVPAAACSGQASSVKKCRRPSGDGAVVLEQNNSFLMSSNAVVHVLICCTHAIRHAARRFESPLKWSAGNAMRVSESTTGSLLHGHQRQHRRQSQTSDGDSKHTRAIVSTLVSLSTPHAQRTSRTSNLRASSSRTRRANKRREAVEA